MVIVARKQVMIEPDNLVAGVDLVHRKVVKSQYCGQNLSQHP